MCVRMCRSLLMGAGTNKPEIIDPGGVRKLLYLIDSLRATPAGNLIYRQAAGHAG